MGGCGSKDTVTTQDNTTGGATTNEDGDTPEIQLGNGNSNTGISKSGKKVE